MEPTRDYINSEEQISPAIVEPVPTTVTKVSHETASATLPTMEPTQDYINSVEYILPATVE